AAIGKSWSTSPRRKQNPRKWSRPSAQNCSFATDRFAKSTAGELWEKQPIFAAAVSFLKRYPIIHGEVENPLRGAMKPAIQKYLEYLRSVRNSSPHTVLNYGKDLEQFAAYLSPPGEKVPSIAKISHQLIREYVGYLHSRG